MNKTLIAMVLVFALLVAFAQVAITQTAEKGWEKTVTLPSGEVILDMSGKWDCLVEYQGMYSGLKSHAVNIEITQEGKTFVGVRLQDTPHWPKGTEAIKGELHGVGFKTVYVNRADVGWTPCKGEISKNGNKMLLDDERVLKLTLKRR